MPLIKYTPPSKYDTAPYATIWQVEKSDKPVDLYVQVSQDELSPNWIPMGDLLILVFKDDIYSDKFIQECLKKI